MKKQWNKQFLCVGFTSLPHLHHGAGVHEVYAMCPQRLLGTPRSHLYHPPAVPVPQVFRQHPRLSDSPAVSSAAVVGGGDNEPGASFHLLSRERIQRSSSLSPFPLGPRFSSLAQAQNQNLFLT